VRPANFGIKRFSNADPKNRFVILRARYLKKGARPHFPKRDFFANRNVDQAICPCRYRNEKERKDAKPPHTDDNTFP
jgi:hypothetical protein